jgi:DNA-binding HxlR family transcriptional regulator
MDLLGKPWNGMLLAVLGDGPLRFSELAARLPQIADRMLAGRLKELEARGVVRRTVDHGPPVRVSYALTDIGCGFREVSEAMSRWGKVLLAAKHPTEAAQKRGRRARAS